MLILVASLEETTVSSKNLWPAIEMLTKRQNWAYNRILRTRTHKKWIVNTFFPSVSVFVGLIANQRESDHMLTREMFEVTTLSA